MGVASIPINLDGGEYIVVSVFKGDDDYVASEAINTIKVKSKINITLDITQISNTVIIKIELNKTVNELITVKVNNNTYTVYTENGIGNLELNNLDNNVYYITATLENDNDFIFNNTSASFEIDMSNVTIIANNLNTSDLSGEKYSITLIDENNNPIAGKEIVFELNGESYLATTDINGIASININLKIGTYEINAKFKGDEEYFPTNTIGIINVKNKVEITIDISKNSNNAIIYIKLSKSLDESLLVEINDVEYIINTVNGRAIINLDNLENGNYFIVAKLINEEEYITNSSNNEFEINLKSLEIISQNMTMADYSSEMYSITLLDSENNPIANKIVVFNINSERYVRTTDINGIASIPINLKPGVYDIQTMFSGDDEFFKNNATNTIVVKEGSTIKDIVIKNNTHDVSIEITLNKQIDEEINFKINDKQYSIITSKGTGILNINLDNGIYDLYVTMVKYNTTKKYTFKVDIPDTIKSYDFTTYYKSNSTYEITLTNNGKKISGKTIIFTLNGKNYTKTTDINGKANITVDLAVGNYVISIFNPETGENISNTIKVVKTIINNKDLVKYYGGNQVYKVLVIGDNNKAVGAGKVVVMKINGKTYNVKTDSKGYASLNVKFAPNTYTITATYKQFSVKNKVVIKSTIVTKNVVKKKSKTAYFYAKLLDSNGKILKYKKVKFTFKGKTYTVKTNSKGIASYKLKNTLKVGKYTIYTSYGTLKDKRTITVVK